MFYTLEGAAKRTGLGEFTILRAIEEGRLAAGKDLFGHWQVHEAELSAFAAALDSDQGQQPAENASTSLADNPDAGNLEIFGPLSSEVNGGRPHLPGDSFTETTQAAPRSTELIPSAIFLPDALTKQKQCGLSEELAEAWHEVGARRGASVHTSAHPASSCEEEIELTDEDRICSEPPHRETHTLRKLPIRGILLLVLGWLGGLSSYHLFYPRFTISKQSIASEKQILAPNAGQRSGAENSGKVAQAPRSNAAAARHPTQRRITSKPMLDQERETTGSIKQQDSVLQDRVLTPFPDTRPSTVSGWTLRSVTDGIAVLEGPYGTWKAARGDLVPGLGKVDSIVLWGNRWIVATTKGLVTTP